MIKKRFNNLWLVLMIGAAAGFVLQGCASRPSAPLWNVPSLIGKPIDVVQKKLGQPKSQVNLAPGMTRSLWQREDVTLSATWKSSNGRVTGYEMISRDDSNALREGETAPLLAPGQLKTSDPAYSTEWIEAANRPLFYTGVRVIPAPRNHAVVIRVTGTEALVQVAYEVTGPGGKSDNLMTIAPWETSFTLPDDAKVAVSGELYKRLNKKPFRIKLEIIADGKVVASAISSGSAVSCNADL